MDELAAGIHRWTAPHPEWRPRTEEVESYALVAGEALLLVDPLVPPEDDERRGALLAQLELLAAAAARVELLVTVPYHTRSAEALYERFAPATPDATLGPRARAQATAARDAARGGADGRRRHGGDHRGRSGRGVHHRPPAPQRAPDVRARSCAPSCSATPSSARRAACASGP